MRRFPADGLFLKTRIISLAALISVAALVSGCFSNPLPQARHEPFTLPTGMNHTYKDMALGLILSGNAKSAVQYAEQYAQTYQRHALAVGAAGRVFEDIFAMFSRQFKTVVKLERVEDAKARNVDLVAVLDVYLEYPSPSNPEDNVRVNLGAKFLTADNTPIDVATTESVSTFSWSARVADNIKSVSLDAIRKLEAAISGSVKLAEFGKSRPASSTMAAAQPQVSPAAPAMPASDVDTLPSATAEPKKHAYAVVIGIESYRERLPKADFADRDAKLVGEYLTKVLGYSEENVVVRTNDKASLTDLIKYFENWLPNNLDKDGSVFVYYSGHGAPNTKTGDAYLVPYDGDPTFVESTGYPVKRLYAALEKLPAKDVTVVLDACFSGAGGRSVIARGSRPMVISVENPILTTGRTVVLAASSGDQISSTYEEQGHGLLTYYFLKGLQGDGDLNKDGAIEMAELYEYVKPNVQRVARRQYNNEQTPQLLASPELLKGGGGRLVERVAGGRSAGPGAQDTPR